MVICISILGKVILGNKDQSVNKEALMKWQELERNVTEYNKLMVKIRRLQGLS